MPPLRFRHEIMITVKSTRQQTALTGFFYDFTKIFDVLNHVFRLKIKGVKVGTILHRISPARRRIFAADILLQGMIKINILPLPGLSQLPDRMIVSVSQPISESSLPGFTFIVKMFLVVIKPLFRHSACYMNPQKMRGVPRIRQ